MGQVKPSSAVCATINLGFIDFKLISITHFSRENICIFEALSSLWFEWDDDDDESNTRLNLNVCGHDILCTRESLAIEKRRLALNNFLTWCCFSLRFRFGVAKNSLRRARSSSSSCSRRQQKRFFARDVDMILFSFFVCTKEELNTNLQILHWHSSALDRFVRGL